jgi:hypothetical protein
MGGHAARIWEKRYGFRVLVGRPEGRTPLGRHRSDRIILKWLLEKQEVLVLQGKDQWRALVNTIMNLWIP